MARTDVSVGPGFRGRVSRATSVVGTSPRRGRWISRLHRRLGGTKIPCLSVRRRPDTLIPVRHVGPVSGERNLTSRSTCRRQIGGVLILPSQVGGVASCGQGCVCLEGGRTGRGVGDGRRDSVSEGQVHQCSGGPVV